MTMTISHLPIVSEARLSDAFALPAGRIIEAELEIKPTSPVLSISGPPDTLELAVEIKQPGGEFEEVASTLQASAPGTYKVVIPTADVAPAVGVPVPVCRLRLLHEGRREMSFRVRVLGI